MTLTAQDRAHLESELDLMRTQQAERIWNVCVSEDARARRNRLVDGYAVEIARLELMLDEG